LGLTSLISFAKPLGGARPPVGGPEVMFEREKQAVYKDLDDLTDDQKQLIDGIYEEFGTTLKETFEASRQSEDREARREKMKTLREEKDLLIKDVLNKEQFQIYNEITSKQKRGRRNQLEN